MSILTENSIPQYKPIPTQNMTELFKIFEPNQVQSGSELRDQINLYSGTPISHAFFSNENLNIIQNGLRAEVFDRSKGQYVISEQDPTIIRSIMRATFDQNVRSPSTDIPSKIQELNTIVIKYCANITFDNARNYMRYRETEGKVVTPMSLPVMASTRNSVVQIRPVGPSSIIPQSH